MYNYSAVRENNKNTELKEYESYGVAVYENGKQIEYIQDVFLSEEEANHYVDLFNDLQLDAVHLQEVCEQILR